MIHKLKTWPRFYEEVCRGDKTFEVRHDDRPFATGDTLILQEWSPFGVEQTDTGDYTGREVIAHVDFVTSLRPLYDAVGMSIRVYEFPENMRRLKLTAS